MIKTLALYLAVFCLLFCCGFYLHSYILGKEANALNFSLVKVYSFHAIFSFLLCCLIYLLSGSKTWRDQLGFIYLAVLIVKVAFFAMMFGPALFEQEMVSDAEKFAFIIPLFLFLVAEVYFIAKTLAKIDIKRN